MKPNLKYYRTKAGFTQKQMAEKIGISTIMYQNMELGNRTGVLDKWERLSAIFGVSIQELRGKQKKERKQRKQK